MISTLYLHWTITMPRKRKPKQRNTRQKYARTGFRSPNARMEKNANLHTELRKKLGESLKIITYIRQKLVNNIIQLVNVATDLDAISFTTREQ